MRDRRGPDPGRLAGLQRIAALHKDAALAEFARAGAAREDLRAHIRALDRAAESGRAAARSAEDATTLAVQDAHAQALNAVRGTANLALARQTSYWLECRDRAALALGRGDALVRIAGDAAQAVAATRTRRGRPGG